MFNTEDAFYKPLSYKEMMKELMHNKEEGILPDIGDLTQDIIDKVLN